jgi:hypothetical protein
VLLALGMLAIAALISRKNAKKSPAAGKTR